MSAFTSSWDIIGHQWAIEVLSSRLSAGQIGHAYLFTGPSQIGKRTLAVKLAQAMNCLHSKPPCGECRHCDLIARGLHPDIQVVEAETRTIKIEQVRDLQHDLTLRPVEAHRRVAILRNFQDASPQAADAMLKTLEEPAQTSHLLLTTDNPERLPATIISRCKTIPLRPVPLPEITTALVQRFGIESDHAQVLASLSGGRPGWAIQAQETPDVLERRLLILEALMKALYGDRTHRFGYVEDIHRDVDLGNVMLMWQSWWRDVLLMVEGSTVAPVNVDRMGELNTIAKHVSPQDARLALRAVRRTIDALAMNANNRLALEIMMLNMPYL